jgi:hypothetical protein
MSTPNTNDSIFSLISKLGGAGMSYNERVQLLESIVKQISDIIVAYSRVCTSFTIPAIGVDATIVLDHNGWIQKDMVIRVGKEISGNWVGGYFQVVSRNDTDNQTITATLLDWDCPAVGQVVPGGASGGRAAPAGHVPENLTCWDKTLIPESSEAEYVLGVVSSTDCNGCETWCLVRIPPCTGYDPIECIS